MKKILSVIIATLLCFGGYAAQARVTIPLNETGFSFADYDSSLHTAIKLKSGERLAHYFETPDSLRKYSVRCPSYSDAIGAMTISVYHWNNSYDETVAQTPLASQTFTNFADNSILSVHMKGFDHSGAYLVTFTNPVQNVGVWRYTQPDNPEITKLFVGDEIIEGGCLEADYITSQNYSVEQIERTPRSAYTRIQAEDFDLKSNSMAVSSQSTTLQPTTAFTFAAFADIDFGTTSPKGINMRVSSNNTSESAEIHVRLDNPESGPKIAEIYFEYRDQIAQWETIPYNITQTITGKHDVYLSCYGIGFLIDWFEFSKTAVGTSFYDQRLADFEPVPDSSLQYTYSDTWSATDMMGRKLPGYETVGARDEEREVGIFYWTWHATPGRLGSTNGTIHNNQWIIKNYIRTTGGTEEDIKNDYNYSGWKHGGFWNESIYGYYHGMDSWVMRKHMELLSAAGVDGLFFDTTNGTNTFTGGYMTLGKTIHEMRQAGIKTPQMSFILPFFNMDYNVEDLRKIYQSMYQPGLYSDTWYYWNGKPVIMGYPDNLSASTGYDDIDALHAEIADYFTFRPGQPDYRSGPLSTRNDQWPWLEVAPQHGYIPLTNSKYAYECVSVGVAMNGNDNGLTAMNGEGVYGRSFTYKDRFSRYSDDSKYYGYNVQEQWDNAFEMNPKFVFLTGWNEWTAGHYTSWMNVPGAYPDQYNDEYSRDIEPTKGDFKDNYYYQMVANIRKFKGVSPTPVASDEKTIRIGGAFSQWDDVGPDFYGYAGGTDTRDSYSQRRAYYYYNDTGRNDIVLSKVARDADNLYFYVKTNEALTSYTDPSWMRLFINTDRTYKTGWEGYDFAVNIENPSSATSTTLSYTKDGWNWKTVGNLTYKYSGNQMMIRIPRDMLGLTDKLIDIEFKWNDNMQNQGDIMDVYNNGDTAPIGRFAYRYTETTEYDKTPVDEPVTVSDLKLNQHKHSIIMAIGKTTAFAGGKQKTLEAAPQLINEKTMIPLRFFSEGFGAEVTWNDATRTATVSLDGNLVSITVGQNKMVANGIEVNLESPAVILNGRTLVPMRDIAQALGKKVLWVDGGLIIAGENPETVHSYEWVQDMTEDNFGIR